MNKRQDHAIHYLKDYSPSDFLIDKVFLHFDLQEKDTLVKAILNIRRNPKSTHLQAPLVLNGEALECQSVALNNHLLDQSQYKVDEESLTIFEVPDEFILETHVIIQPQKNTQLSGLYKSRNNFCTQNESHGFRRITYYLDRPDVMSRFDTCITADKTKYPYLLSNGNLIETRELDKNRHWVHWQDPSLKPSYLFALVAGDFDVIEDTFETMSGRQVKLHFYLEKGYGEQGDYAMASLKRAMQWDEERFGREYDLDIYMVVAVSDFNMGAMENKGLNIFNTKYILAKPETATDMDYVAIEGVIGHEYFHNWSGNRVTCRDWFQITLKEGLTVLRDQLFTEDMTSQAVARLDTVNVVRSAQFLEDAGPMAHPIRPDSYIEVNNFYTVTVYRKGAEVIRMVQTLITPEKFRAGMDLYFHRYDGQAVTTEDFIKAMEDASQKDLTQFQRWYHQAGTPLLEITSDYDENAKTFTLHVKQSCPATPGQSKKEPFHLPLCVGLVGEACQDLSLQLQGDERSDSSTTKVLEVKNETDTFVFHDVKKKPVPSLLRGFSAPVKIKYPYTDEELAWLLLCDSDPFARWNAAQEFAFNMLSMLINNAKKNKAMALTPLFLDTFKQLLDLEHADLNYLSRLLMLPSEHYLFANMPGVNVDVIFNARQFIKTELAKQLETKWRELYQQHRLNAPYQYNMQSMGQRCLTNLCLSYLLETGKSEYDQLAFEQFQNADNMTDTVGALQALNNHAVPEREKALHAFYAKWQHEALVVNKWLLIQSSSALPNTLEQVKSLTQHPSFDIRNPNKVYSLLVGFGNNLVRFHEEKGAGYQFIADQVIAIDADNPQVAARVLTPLTQWKLLDKHRADLVQKQLHRIANVSGLSKDTYEIVTKSIAD